MPIRAKNVDIDARAIRIMLKVKLFKVKILKINKNLPRGNFY